MPDIFDQISVSPVGQRPPIQGDIFDLIEEQPPSPTAKPFTEQLEAARAEQRREQIRTGPPRLAGQGDFPPRRPQFVGPMVEGGPRTEVKPAPVPTVGEFAKEVKERLFTSLVGQAGGPTLSEVGEKILPESGQPLTVTGTVKQTVGVTGRVAAGLGDFLTSPGGIATLAAGIVGGPPVATGLGLAFAIDLGSGAIEAGKKFYEKPTPENAEKFIISIGFAGLPWAHAGARLKADAAREVKYVKALKAEGIDEGLAEAMKPPAARPVAPAAERVVTPSPEPAVQPEWTVAQETSTLPTAGKDLMVRPAVTPQPAGQPTPPQFLVDVLTETRKLAGEKVATDLAKNIIDRVNFRPDLTALEQQEVALTAFREFIRRRRYADENMEQSVNLAIALAGTNLPPSRIGGLLAPLDVRDLTVPKEATVVAQESPIQVRAEPLPGIPPVPRRGPIKPASPLRKFVNPETEGRFQAAKVSPQETWWARTKQSLETFKHRATRTYEHLERGEQYGPLIFNLKQNEVAGSIAVDRTLRDLTGIVKGMDRNQLDLFSKRVVLDDLAENYARLTAQGERWDELAFGITSKELAAESARFRGLSEADQTVRAALKQRQGMIDAARTDYIAVMDKVGVDLGDRLTRENYFRHRVLENLADKVNVGQGKRLRTPTGRGFLKGRAINSLDYSTNYLESEFEVIAQMRADTAKAKTLAWVADEKNGLNIASQMRAEAKRINQEMKAAGDKGSPVMWEDLVPEGYGLWQPREGNVFYLAKSIPESIANKLLEGVVEEIGLTAKDVRKVLAMGGKRNQLVLPNEVIATLDNLGRAETDPYLRASAKLLNYWKQWQLISPGRVVTYNLRNLSGDLDAVIAGNPSALRQMRQTIADLVGFYVNGKISQDLKGYLERGGIQTLLQAQEMGNVTALKDLRRFAETEKSTMAKISRAPVGAVTFIAQKLRSATDFREAILRYATYLDYLRQMREVGGKPKNYGASIPEEVMALKDPKDRAFKLQNDLVGAYNEIAVTGQHVRRHWYPFWSFPEINIRRYTQLFRNASREGKMPEQIGRSLLGKVPATAYTAYQVGKFAMKASALWAIVTAQNLLFFPDEEEELPDEVKGRLHIVLGRTKDGQIRYSSRLGAVGDLLEWVGLDAPQQLVQDYLNGRKTVKEIAVEMAQSPVNKVVSGLSPFPKMPIELLTGKALFPDISRPRTIRDRGLYAAQQFAVDGIYRELTGLPARPYLSSLNRTLVYYSDPGEAAYYGTLDLKASYLRKINKGGEGTFTSPRTEAIRNVKLAVRYNDKKAVEKYVAEYVALGGKRSGIVESIERMEPLYGLNKKQKRDFRSKLSVADSQRLEKAEQFWRDVLKKGKVETRAAIVKMTRKTAEQISQLPSRETGDIFDRIQNQPSPIQ